MSALGYEIVDSQRGAEWPFGYIHLMPTSASGIIVLLNMLLKYRKLKLKTENYTYDYYICRACYCYSHTMMPKIRETLKLYH